MLVEKAKLMRGCGLGVVCGMKQVNSMMFEHNVPLAANLVVACSCLAAVLKRRPSIRLDVSVIYSLRHALRWKSQV
jgi:hypothetical protein